MTATARRRSPAPVPFVLDFLGRSYPDARILLSYRNPFELLVATVLAAQCTDERVNKVTPALFRKYPGPQAFASAAQEEMEEAVRPTGFYRNKATAVRGLSRAIVEGHGGKVPKTMGELTELPGVGRKTAAIILGACRGDRSALPVDTHVARVAFRLGLTGSTEAGQIERDLIDTMPAERRWEFATRLGWHGRQVCIARKPRCTACGLLAVCPRNGVTVSA